jgi:hypothetical protein
VHIWQTPPAEPQAEVEVPGLHVEVPLGQHPEGQVCEHAGLTHWPFWQIWEPVHIWQTPPAEPHAEVEVPGLHVEVPLGQHPEEQVCEQVGVTHWPFWQT